MRLDHVDFAADAAQPSAKVWHLHQADLMAVAVWTELRAGRGEDAEPTVLFHQPTGHGIIGVYDGLGGAGASVVGRSPDGRPLTSAYIASRLAHLAVRQWFVQLPEHNLRYGDTHQTLQHALAESFAAARPRRRSNIRGTLRRELPTTLAALEFQLEEATVAVRAHWSGDSRCFLLGARRGLQQFSRDDADSSDALDSLVVDGPMTNLVNASSSFTINTRDEMVAQPIVLVVATDGFFHWVDTPAHFEFHLLHSLMLARNTQEWGEKLVTVVRSYTRDDASLVLLPLGFGSFAELQDHFLERFQAVKEHWDLYPAGELDRDTFVDLREKSWSAYQRDYSALL